MIQDIEILYQQEYVGRVILVVKYKDKIAFVYKRSGFNNPESEGDIVPFMFLNTRITPRGEPLGYIFKEYLVEGQWKKHYKVFYRKEKQFLDSIWQVTKEIRPLELDDEVLDKLIHSEDFIDTVNMINSHLRTYTDEFEFLDYGRDL